MPAYAKTIITILVAVAAFFMFRHESAAGAGFAPWLTVGLAVFMILAVWLFPEAKGGKRVNRGPQGR